MASAFESALETIAWAGQAINEFDADCQQFFSAAPIRSVVDFDRSAGVYVKKWKLLTPLPSIISRRATEAISHIKHSFDQSIFAACKAIHKTPRESIYFPWATTPEDLEHRLSRGKKIPPELWPILRSFAPYPQGGTHTGGDDTVRALAKLANRKHTIRLTFTVTLTNISMKNIHARGPIDVDIPRWNPVRNEIVIARLGPGAEFAADQQIDIYISFNESSPLKDVAVHVALHHFLAKAQSVAEALAQEARVIGRLEESAR